MEQTQSAWPRARRILLAAGIALSLLGGEGRRLLAQDSSEPVTRDGEPSLDEQVQRLQKELEALKKRLDDDEARSPDAPAEPTGGGSVDGAVEITPPWERAGSTPPALRGIFDRPFLASFWRRAYLGGYMELEYHGFENDLLEIPRGFRLHRTNLFLYADLSENLRFASEIEFEYEHPDDDLETTVEMAFVDWVLAEELVVRGGALLVPLGRINVNHDGPIREFTSRPLVSTFVIPTTLTDPGVGLLGTFALSDTSSFSYEAYATNGFDILDEDGTLSVSLTEIEKVLREGTPSNGGDNNKSVATTGRISLASSGASTPDDESTPVAFEAGLSWHVGNYDERNRNLLAIVAADWAAVWGPFTFEGEAARAGFERDTFSKTSGVPDEFTGYYLQAAYNFLPEWLKNQAPSVFGRPGATFTGAVRYDWVDLDDDRASALELGLNFRPFTDTVFKFSYRFGLLGFAALDRPEFNDSDSRGFSFSLSSYF